MKRRDFVKTGGAITIGAVGGITNFAIGKNLQDTLRIGVIGTGDRGGGHIRLIKDISGMEVVAACDILPFRLDPAVANTKNAKPYRDYRKLLEDKKVDAVIVAAPLNEHAQMAIDTIDAGKHVYCEKTMVKGIESTLDLTEKVRSSSVVFQTGYQWHSSSLYKKIVAMLQKDYIGELSTIECFWNRNGNWRRPVPDPKWERAINWRMYREYSSGLTAELCSHQMDICNWILDERPEVIMGVGGIDYWKDGRETYDNVHITTKYASGVTAKFTSLTSNKSEGFQLKFYGKKGTIKSGFGTATIAMENFDELEKGLVDGVSGATIKAWQAGEGAPIEVEQNNDPTIDALNEFRTSVLQGGKPKSDIIAGARGSIAVQMSLDAMDNGSVEKWTVDI